MEEVKRTVTKPASEDNIPVNWIVFVDQKQKKAVSLMILMSVLLNLDQVSSILLRLELLSLDCKEEQLQRRQNGSNLTYHIKK